MLTRVWDTVSSYSSINTINHLFMACLTLPSFTGPVALPPALTDVLLCEDVLGADSSRANNWTKVRAATSA